jgi:hypothetical protein
MEEEVTEHYQLTSSSEIATHIVPLHGSSRRKTLR